MIRTALSRGAGEIPWRAAAALAMAVGCFAAGWVTNGWRANSEIKRLEAQQAAERGEQAYAMALAIDKVRLEEQRRFAAQTEIAHAATKDAESARTAARDAHAAADRLRQRVAQLVAAGHSAGHSFPATAGASTADPIGMLADVLGRADRRAGILAEYADSARIAGQACERAYDALNAEGSALRWTGNGPVQ